MVASGSVWIFNQIQSASITFPQNRNNLHEGCAVENYYFVTKNSSFRNLYFEIGPSLLSAILKSGRAGSGPGPARSRDCNNFLLVRVRVRYVNLLACSNFLYSRSLGSTVKWIEWLKGLAGGRLEREVLRCRRWNHRAVYVVRATCAFSAPSQFRISCVADLSQQAIKRTHPTWRELWRRTVARHQHQHPAMYAIRVSCPGDSDRPDNANGGVWSQRWPRYSNLEKEAQICNYILCIKISSCRLFFQFL